MKKKWVKVLGIGFGVLFGLFLLAAIVVPLVVDVDAYRPQIVETAGEKLNGELELGKLSLSLWGQVKVQVDGFALKDPQGKPIVSAKDVYFKIPFLSVLSGAPHVTFNLNQPEVFVEKDPRGELNVMKVVKEGTIPEASEESPSEAKEESSESGLPSMVQNARLGVALTNARLAYKDAATGVSSEFKDLNLIVKDLSLTRSSEIELWGNIDTKMEDGTFVKGPVRVTAAADSQSSGGEFQQSNVSFKVDFSEIVVEMPETFSKTADVPAFAEGELTLTKAAASFDRLKMQFHNLEFEGQGKISNVLEASKEKPMRVDVRFGAQPVALAPWKKLIHALQPYEVAGEINFKGWVRGPVEKLDYQADLGLDKMTLSGANLKTKPQIKAGMKIVTNRVEYFSMQMRAPGNELRIAGNLTNFSAPRVAIQVNSTGMDLDQLIKYPEPVAAAGGKGAKAQTEAAFEEADFDAMLDPLRKNAIAKKATGQLTLRMDKLKSYNVTMSRLRGVMKLRALNTRVENFALNVFGGTISTKGQMNLAPKMPTYRLSVAVRNLDMQKAVASQFMPFKDTLVGMANLDTTISGKSLNPKGARAYLNGRGRMDIKNAVFNTIDIGREASKALNGSLAKVAEKVPQLKGKNLGSPKAQKSEYDSVTGNFTIKDGLFHAPDFFARAKPNAGIDVKGDTQVNLVDDSLKARWELIDTYNELKARDLNVKIAGVQVNHVLAEGDGPVRLPIEVEGTLFAPKISYKAVPEALAKVAVGNVKRAGEAKAKAEVKKTIENKAKSVIKGLFN